MNTAAIDFGVLLTGPGLISLLSLTLMEVVLGIDNIVFVAILSQKLGSPEKQKQVRRIGLALALIFRLGLLFTLSWLMGMTKPLFRLLGDPISGRDLVLLIGGLFLMGKASHELYENIEGDDAHPGVDRAGPSAPRGNFTLVLLQILALDLVFSLDSVITAVGMAPQIAIMIVAMVIAVVVMLIFAEGISHFIARHLSMKVLALSFLLLIGVLLVADAFGRHIPKGYVYFAMAFSIFIELLNLRRHKKKGKLQPTTPAAATGPTPTTPAP